MHTIPIKQLHKLQNVTKKISDCYRFLFIQEQINGFISLIAFVDGYINQLNKGIPTCNKFDYNRDIDQEHTIIKLQKKLEQVEGYFLHDGVFFQKG
jgi:hypothetical protein